MISSLPRTGWGRDAAGIGVLTALSVLGAALTGCSSSAADDSSDTVTVVTSTDVYANLAATVGGGDVAVTALVSAEDQDPHSYESDARDLLAVSKADLVVENGGGYDDFIDRLVESASNDPTVLTAVDVAAPAQAADGTANEHVWYDLSAMEAMTAQVASALATIDPPHAEEFRARARALSDDIAALVTRERQLKKQLAGTPVSITEPVPVYLLDALSLHNLTPAAFSEAVEEGEDVPVGVLAATLDLYGSHQVAALIYNEQTTGATTEQVRQAAEDAGIPVVAVSETLPPGMDYVSWMTANLDAVAQALSR